MFVERFDALMNIAELSNSQLGREISMNPSRIGRLRSGARPLPKHHEFLPVMCGQLSFLSADVLAKEGVCHTKPAPVGR